MDEIHILFLVITIIISTTSAIDSDQQFADSNKNIHLYLSPHSSVSQEPEKQYTSYVLEEHRSSGPEEKQIVAQVVEEGKKIFLIEPKSEPTQSENSFNKFELEREGPKKKKVTIKVIKEEKKIFEVDPKLINNDKNYESENKKNIEYENSGSGYELKLEEPKDKNIILKLIKDNKSTFAVNPEYKNENIYYQTEYKQQEPEYKKIIIKQEEPKEKNLILKVVNANKIPLAVDSKYKNENIFFESEYKKPEIEYENSESGNSDSVIKFLVPPNSRREMKDEELNSKNVLIKVEEPKKKNIFVEVVNEDKNKFLADSRYKNDDKYFEPEYKASNDDKYDKYEIKGGLKEKNVLVQVVNDNKKVFVDDLKYKSGDTYLEPNYRRSETEYKSVEQEYQKIEPPYNQYGGKREEPEEKDVYVQLVNSNKKTIDDDPKYKKGHIYFEPGYRKSVTEYQNSESDYQKSDYAYNKYGGQQGKPEEKKIYFKVINEDKKPIIVDSKYENKNNFEFKKEYENSEIEYRELSEPNYKQFKIKREKPEKKEVYFKEDNEDKKTFIIDPEYENNKNSETHYKKFKKEYDTSEKEYRKSLEPAHKQYEIKREESEAKRVYFKKDNDKKTFVTDSEYENNENSGQDYKKFKNEYGTPETGYRKSSEPAHKQYEIKLEEPEEKRVYLNEDNEDQKTFISDTKHENNKDYDQEYKEFEKEYKKSEPEYRKPESESNQYEGKGEKVKEKRLYFNVDKEDRKTFVTETKYKNNNLEPEYRKSEKEYERLKPEYRKSEPPYDQYDGQVESNKKRVKYEKEGKKVFVITSKYENDNNFEQEERKLENDYEKSGPEYYRKPEPEYEVKGEEPKEKQALYNVDNEEKTVDAVDPRYKNRNFEPVYRKYKTEYEKHEPEYKPDLINNQYEGKGEQLNEKKILYNIDNDSKKNLAVEPNYENNNNNNFEPKYNFEKENENSEEENNRKESAEDKSNEDELKEKEIFVNVVKQNDKSYEPKLQLDSESKYEEPKHDVVVKIWTKKS